MDCTTPRRMSCFTSVKCRVIISGYGKRELDFRHYDTKIPEHIHVLDAYAELCAFNYFDN